MVAVRARDRGPVLRSVRSVALAASGAVCARLAGRSSVDLMRCSVSESVRSPGQTVRGVV